MLKILIINYDPDPDYPDLPDYPEYPDEC